MPLLTCSLAGAAQCSCACTVQGRVRVWEVQPWQTVLDLRRFCCSAVYLSLPSNKELVRRATSMVHSGLDSADGLWISYFCALLLPIVAIIWVVVD